MAGPPGIAYVYLVYGMYDCLNVVTGPDGDPSAVLIRAVEPLEGLDLMRADRVALDVRRRRAARSEEGAAAVRERLDRTSDQRLASGPGLVAAAFGIDTSWTGTDMCDGGSPLRLGRDADEPADRVTEAKVVATSRVGVAYAGADWASRPWRFALDGHPSVSGPRSR